LAISQLGDTRVETRIGGIYGLAQIAEQAPENNGPVGEVLVAYVNRLPRPKRPPTTLLSEHAPDVQAALTVLTQYDQNADGTKDYAWLVHRLDLHALGLRGANLLAADLGGATFLAADLRGANLVSADLSDVDLRGADLRDTDLRGANLVSADLREADIRGADMRGAGLLAADLRSADLRDADLRDANLRGANLVSADLQDAELRDAKADDRTGWPVGFDWRRAGVRPT
jgi:hypothetical protein